MVNYKALVGDMIDIHTVPGDRELFVRNARMAEDLLMEEVARSSAKVYSYAWLRFRGYCGEVGKEAVPADVDMLVPYLAKVCEKGLVACMQTARSKKAHFRRKKFQSFPSSTESLTVKQLLIAIKRRHGKPVVKREPAKAEVVWALFEHFLLVGGTEECSLKKWKFASLYVLLFFSNTRFKEVANL